MELKRWSVSTAIWDSIVIQFGDNPAALWSVDPITKGKSCAISAVTHKNYKNNTIWALGRSFWDNSLCYFLKLSSSKASVLIADYLTYLQKCFKYCKIFLTIWKRDSQNIYFKTLAIVSRFFWDYWLLKLVLKFFGSFSSFFRIVSFPSPIFRDCLCF